jgi:hypothetical protein
MVKHIRCLLAILNGFHYAVIKRGKKGNNSSFPFPLLLSLAMNPIGGTYKYDAKYGGKVFNAAK